MTHLNRTGKTILLAIALAVAGCGEATADDRVTTNGSGSGQDESPRSDDASGMFLSFQLHQVVGDRGNRMVIVDFDRELVILSYSYDGQPTETIRYQGTKERLEEGRQLAANLAALWSALGEDDEFSSNRSNRTCASYNVYVGHYGTGGGGVLCDDTTYSSLSEAMRDYMQPYLDEIPPPPPLP